MAWHSSGTTNAELVEKLWTNKLITDQTIKAAFLEVDRGHYAPTSPYTDSPQSIGYGANISAPHMHACAIEHLLPYLMPISSNPAPRVLDIGSGSGYLTHVIAELVGEGGRVVGVEHIPQLKDLAERNMSKSEQGREFLRSGRVKFVVGDGRRGWTDPGQEPGEGKEKWDAIHIGASATEVHQALIDQLKSPGRMFIPIDDDGGGWNQHVWTVDKDADGNVNRKKLFGVRYVPLTDAPSES